MNNPDSNKLQLFLTRDSECSYLPDQKSRSLLIDPELRLNPGIYSRLLAHGFRRSGGHVYKPHCDACRSCHPTRIPVESFQLKRRHRRTLKKNHDLNIKIRDKDFSEDHFDLYKAYQESRHPGGSMANSTPVEYETFLTTSWCESLFLEFWLGNKLVGVAVTDLLPDALSAVYTFFDPELGNRSLGNYAILQQIRIAQEANLDYLYLGYWIKECRKMSYKTQYQPIEVFRDERWGLHSDNENTS